MNLSILKIDRNQALFNVLRIFEDACRLPEINALSKRKIKSTFFKSKKYIDAINYALTWIYKYCPYSEDYKLMETMSDDDYEDAKDILLNHAYPYSKICEGYIGHSRGCYVAKLDVKKHILTFNFNKPQRRNFIASTLDFIDRKDKDQKDISAPMSPEAFESFINSISVLKGMLTYVPNRSIILYYKEMSERQWDTLAKLPSDWTFDHFNTEEFRSVWVSLLTLCLMHYNACVFSRTTGFAYEHNVYFEKIEGLYRKLEILTHLNVAKIKEILTYITFDNSLPNNDIFYQPIISLNKDNIAIVPHVLMLSNPERNLISLLAKKQDSNYSRLSNLLETLMQKEIDEVVNKRQDIISKKNIQINNSLPDIDYLIYSPQSRSVLICELKWLNEPDSPKEVFSREDEIEKGCEQVRKLSEYFEQEGTRFIAKLLDIESNKISMYYCLVSKFSTRSRSSDIPVISLQRLLSLIKTKNIRKTFEFIKNRKFMKRAPISYIMGYETISYGGYLFKIPTLIKWL